MDAVLTARNKRMRNSYSRHFFALATQVTAPLLKRFLCRARA